MFENRRAKNNIAARQKTRAEAVDPNMGSMADNRKSLSKLKELRRREFCPDPSYDLNGDGAVAQKELLIAARFDKNRDGVLDDEERKECMAALNSGLEA